MTRSATGCSACKGFFSPRRAGQGLTPRTPTSHIKLDLELVERADAALRDKIRSEGQELFEEQDRLAARRDELSVGQSASVPAERPYRRVFRSGGD